MKVTLRQRLKGDKITLYLDYYHQGKRNYEHLQLTLYPDPEKGKLTKEQKEENRKNLALQKPSAAKDIWSCRMAFMVSKTRAK
jgi:hypothetical protein